MSFEMKLLVLTILGLILVYAWLIGSLYEIRKAKEEHNKSLEGENQDVNP
ncbi:hypothetical protein SEA_MAKAI_52 [Arthrobacter phage Makai]|nr:hypothetical protein SEA_MAKAI_52 [Arthrobacter phage Makai]QPX62514.1 membrane protein [Arthrobacter phage Truckee]